MNPKYPVYFIGHGSPMNAIEENEFTLSWKNITSGIAKPKAVLCISAHWETRGTKVTTMQQPKTIHDFYGFPEQLNAFQYPAPGAPEIADSVRSSIKKATILGDKEWGLDHGAWSVLTHIYPHADVPIFQMSIDYTKPPLWHYELAQELNFMRKNGILIIGSGNIVHNLGLMRLNNPAFDWAEEFDSRIKSFLTDGNHDAIINFNRMGTIADLSVPTSEHFIPLIYTCGLSDKKDPITFYNEKTVLGSISMRTVKFG